jgi:hypothetical protein
MAFPSLDTASLAADDLGSSMHGGIGGMPFDGNSVGFGSLYAAAAPSSSMSIVYVPVVHSLNWGLAHCAGN